MVKLSMTYLVRYSHTIFWPNIIDNLEWCIECIFKHTSYFTIRRQECRFISHYLHKPKTHTYISFILEMIISTSCKKMSCKQYHYYCRLIPSILLSMPFCNVVIVANLEKIMVHLKSKYQFIRYPVSNYSIYLF